MQLTTQVNVGKSDFQLSHQDKILTLGSCFSDEMGKSLRYHQFNVSVNPMGTTFHPLSLSKTILKAINGSIVDVAELVQNQGIHHHFDFHSQWSHQEKALVASNINRALDDFRLSLKQTDFLFLTFGTSIGFRRKATGDIVNNCHQFPANEFEKVHCTTKQIIRAVDLALKSLSDYNSKLQVILTVSPVRHTRFGLSENLISKSSLILACHGLVQEHAHVHYFPSYEIFIDELRDYRFYKEDLIHPSEMAVHYLWQKFSEHYFTKETELLNQRIKQIQKDLNHRPRFPDSPAHLKFQEGVKEKIEGLKGSHPEINWNL